MSLISENITKAILFALKAHEGQLRKDDKPYIIHPLSVGFILESAGYGEEVVIAGILHDVVEDTQYTKADIEKKFGARVAELVMGVTKDESLPGPEREQAYLDNLKTADDETRAVSAADLLDNRRAILQAIEDKYDIWSKFSRSPEKYVADSFERLDIIRTTVNNEITAEVDMLLRKIK